MKISEILEKLIALHAPLDPARPTCDGVIAGDPDKECTGIATTCCHSAAVIKEAAKRGCNLLICHEPTFFDGYDKTDWLKNDSVYAAKKKLIDESGMVIFRNHDRLHSDVPDGIFSPVTKLLGWEGNMLSDGFMPGCVFEFPKTTVRETARRLSEVTHAHGMRIIGDPDMEITRVGFTFHFFGTETDRTCIEFIEKNDVQVIIPGETVDWTIGEYVQDALTFGKKRALINVGHFNWEEPGMEYMAMKLPDVIGKDIPVHFIRSGSGFDWLEF